jgi:hypothetical protein
MLLADAVRQAKSSRKIESLPLRQVERGVILHHVADISLGTRVPRTAVEKTLPSETSNCHRPLRVFETDVLPELEGPGIPLTKCAQSHHAIILQGHP